MARGVNPKIFGISLALNSIALAISSFYVEEVRRWTPVAQGLTVMGISLVQMYTASLLDGLSTYNRDRSVTKKIRDIETRSTKKSRDLADLRDVIVSFVENSSIYRDRVKKYLKLDEDFLCIAKSSEGLSDVFEAIGGGVQLPFTRTLHNLPGSVKPLETMDLFMIPVRNLPGLRRRSLSEYIRDHIIPKARRERAKFLRGISRSDARLAEEFSFKYVAFLVNRDAFAYGTKNRKFNQAFVNLSIAENVVNDFRNLKNELSDTVRTKEIFRLVDWRAFADLNDERSELVDYYKEGINEALEANGIVSLRDIAETSAENLAEIIYPIVYRRSTRKKVSNLCAAVVEGANRTLDILSANGVTL